MDIQLNPWWLIHPERTLAKLFEAISEIYKYPAAGKGS
jgi:hypothetical protein